jgi:hypothetical protein
MPSEPEYLLVEAVNIDATVFDTTQISVIRGSSYLLARAIRTIARHPGLGAGLEALSIGGSSGLFRVGGHLKAADRVWPQIGGHLYV